MMTTNNTEAVKESFNYLINLDDVKRIAEEVFPMMRQRHSITEVCYMRSKKIIPQMVEEMPKKVRAI